MVCVHTHPCCTKNEWISHPYSCGWNNQDLLELPVSINTRMVTVSSSHTVPSLQQAMGGNSSTDSFPRISGNNGVLQVSQNILLCQWESIDNPYISVAIPSGIQLPIITYQHTDHDIILSMNIHEQQSCHPHPKAAFGELKKFCFECKNLNPQYTQLLLLAF